MCSWCECEYHAQLAKDIEYCTWVATIMDFALVLLRKIALERYFGLVRIVCRLLQQIYLPLIEYLLLKLN